MAISNVLVPTTDPAVIHAATSSSPPSGSTTNLRPLGDRVVIRPTPREEMTKSGIVIPDTAKEKPQEGSIVAAGPGRLTDEGSREPMDIAVGNTVLYAKYAGTEFTVDGEELLIVSQKDILAVVAGFTLALAHGPRSRPPATPHSIKPRKGSPHGQAVAL
jgi:chaperonin GroES